MPPLWESSSRYNCFNRHRKPFYKEKGGDTGYIRYCKGEFLPSIRESLRFPYLRGAATKPEEVWMLGKYQETDFVEMNICL